MNKQFSFNLQTFADGPTKTANVINPQVMADMVSAGLPKAIKFTPIAKIDDTLTGAPGNEITIPAWGYIGDAEDIAEGEEIKATQMSASVIKATIKKAMKRADITDEAKLSGYGDPVGEATRQLRLSIASKIDQDVVTALGGATLTITDTKAISYAGVVNAVDKLNEEDYVEKYLFVAPSQITALRKDPDFIDKTKYGNDVMMTGEVGMIAGCRVVTSRRIDDSKANIDNFIVGVTAEVEDGTPVLPAVTIYIKRDVMVEADRVPEKGLDKIVANEHYVAALTNQSKVVKATFKK
jgi:N4-gp56 family major capsid protein